MAQAAYASGPIAFTTSAGGEIYVPLEVVSIDASGKVALQSGFGAADAAAIQAWLQYLVSIGEIVALPAPAPPAVDLQATNVGAAGNHINAAVAYLPNSATYTFTASQTDVFGPLTAADAQTKINGLAHGLVQVSGVGAGFAPPYKRVITSTKGAGTISGSGLALATTSAPTTSSVVSVAIDAATPSLTVKTTTTITVTPPTSIPAPTGQESQQSQIADGLAFIAVVSSADVTQAGVVLVPTGPTTDTPFDAATNTLALTAASGNALTLTAIPAASSNPATIAVHTTVSAHIVPSASSYQLIATRTDVYTGSDLTPDKLAVDLGTTGDSPSCDERRRDQRHGRGADGWHRARRVQAGLSESARRPSTGWTLGGWFDPDAGLTFAPTAALAASGVWTITVTPIDPSAGSFSFVAAYTNAGQVDTTQAVAAQKIALDGVGTGLFTTTPYALLLPQGGTYGLNRGDATNAAKISIPARS